MSIIISYNKYNHNWYVGELYEAFTNSVKSELNATVIPIEELAQKYSEPYSSRENGYPSIFNIYNLIVYNTSKQTGLIHSLMDYAPVILEHKSALDKLYIKAVSFSSNFTSDLTNRYAYLNLNLIPSFYILENWDDIEHIEQRFSASSNRLNKCYFNGASYGYRSNYINNLKHNSFFDLKDKSEAHSYRSKKAYYDELSQYKYGLSLNGAAQICYRDLECFGLGVLCLREPMDIQTSDPLLPDKHYKIVLDDYIRNNIYYSHKAQEITERLLNNINSISNEEYLYITNNAREWFIKNINKNNQINFLKQCLIENNII